MYSFHDYIWMYKWDHYNIKRRRNSSALAFDRGPNVRKVMDDHSLKKREKNNHKYDKMDVCIDSPIQN